MLATCTFCGNPASLGPMPTVWVCRACAERIGKVATGVSTDRVWSRETRPPRQGQLPAEHADVERVFEEFKANVAKQIAPDDFEVHLDLAEAYREMGLLEDALREACFVLTRSSTRLSPVATKMTDIALRLVLTPPLLKPRGLHYLKRLLHRPS